MYVQRFSLRNAASLFPNFAFRRDADFCLAIRLWLQLSCDSYSSIEKMRNRVEAATIKQRRSQRASASNGLLLRIPDRSVLARVSPAVLKAYRAERLTLEQVMAFAVSDDHAAQEHVLENLHPNDRGQRSIRDALTENEIAASDRRVKFVTLGAYEKAGGKTRRDLFSEGAESVFILDAPLLDSLVGAKLERAAKPLATEGWKWIDVLPVFTYEQKTQLRRIHAEPAALPPKLAGEVEALEKERDTLTEQRSAPYFRLCFRRQASSCPWILYLTAFRSET